VECRRWMERRLRGWQEKRFSLKVTIQTGQNATRRAVPCRAMTQKLLLIPGFCELFKHLKFPPKIHWQRVVQAR